MGQFVAQVRAESRLAGDVLLDQDCIFRMQLSDELALDQIAVLEIIFSAICGRVVGF
jgi:hypothetical protein